MLALFAFACATVAAGCVQGCDDDDDDGAARGLSADDCAPTLRLPLSPRIMEVLDDGSLHAGPPCATANCLAGARGAWGYRDATSTKIEVGAQRVELPLPAAGDAPSVFAAQHALRGFVIGKELAVVDRGAELEIVTPAGTTRVPAPPLREGELVHNARRDVDGRFFMSARPAKRVSRSRLIVLHPPGDVVTAPHVDASAVWDDDARVGWLLPAQDGRPPSIQRNDGSVVPLAPPLQGAQLSARAIGDRFIVRLDRQHSYVVGADGAVVAELPPRAGVATHEGVVYVIDSRPPGAFHVVGERGLEPLLVARAGHDLAGTPLPEGAAAQRVEVAFEKARALIATRVQLATCTLEDRLALVDLRTKEARTIATGDVMRMHPTYAGDRFRYVEADASYEAH